MNHLLQPLRAMAESQGLPGDQRWRDDIAWISHGRNWPIKGKRPISFGGTLRHLARARYHSGMENIEQLRQYLWDNGYSPFLTSNEVDRIAVLDWLIERTVTGWRVGFFERGQFTEVVIATDNERDAVQCFLRTVSAEIYHLKTFKDLDGVSMLEAALQAAEVAYQRNDVPHENLLRVFVSGPNLRQAQDIAARMIV